MFNPVDFVIFFCCGRFLSGLIFAVYQGLVAGKNNWQQP